MGPYILGHIADVLASQGFGIRRASSFRFGNDGSLVSEEVARFLVRKAKKILCIKAAVLLGARCFLGCPGYE